MAWQNSSVANLVAQTVSRNEGLQYAPMYARVVLNSGTGSVRSVFLQSSNVPL
jgi:hypothetical protein